MNDYIDRKELLCRINKRFMRNGDGSWADNDYNHALIGAKLDIFHCSVFTDVKPVCYGHWVKNGLIFYRNCSICDATVDIAISDRAKYCPYCGYPMTKKEENNEES